MKLHLTIILAISVAVAVGAEMREPPQGSGEGSCSEAGCHAEMKAAPVVHAPIAEDSCDMCHEHQGEGHAFEIAADPIADVCTACHEIPESEDHTLHGALADGECTACHDPHSSEEDSLLLAGVPDLCITCHEDPREAGENVHAAAEDGECTMCHEPHASPNRKLLRENGKDLCLGCHESQAEELEQGHVHGVIESLGCSACHNPHASTASKLLRAEGNNLCNECHQSSSEIQPGVDDNGVTLFDSIEVEAGWLSKVTRIALHDGRGHPVGTHPVQADENPGSPGSKFWCGSCHSPHGSPGENLLAGGAGMGFCAKCHKK
jgi:predicted CXXCH cytochrome family protein